MNIFYWLRLENLLTSLPSPDTQIRKFIDIQILKPDAKNSIRKLIEFKDLVDIPCDEDRDVIFDLDFLEFRQYENRLTSWPEEI